MQVLRTFFHKFAKNKKIQKKMRVSPCFFVFLRYNSICENMGFYILMEVNTKIGGMNHEQKA